jgi:hypothetical protein
VDQVQVDVVDAELGQGAGKGGLDGLAGAAGGFGGDVEGGARDGAAGDGGTEFALVAVGWWRLLVWVFELFLLLVGVRGRGVRGRGHTFGAVQVVVTVLDGR